VRPQGEVETRIAEHRGRVDRQRAHEALHALDIVQHPVLKRGDGVQALVAHREPDPAAEGALGVFAKIVPVVSEHPLEEQVALDVVQRDGMGWGGVHLRFQRRHR
jgi:hypothetical protein